MSLRFLLFSQNIILSILFCNFPGSLQAEPLWPRWRGPAGTGHSNEADLPIRWTDDNILWSTDLNGAGQSSPVAWGNRIFLTTSTEKGAARHVLCIDRHSGQHLWKNTAWKGVPERVHGMNSWASPTCVTDGECVVAFFGDAGIHCYEVDGTPRWSHDLGKFSMNDWGVASSPILVGDLVVQNCDADNVAFIVAFHKRTGEEVWRTQRPRSRSWSTPIITDMDGQPVIVVNGHFGIHAYEPQTGKSLWAYEGGSGRGSPSVVTHDDLIIGLSGLCRGEGDLIALPVSSRGEVAADALRWSVARPRGRDLPSPIVVGQFLFTVSLRPGLAICYDATTGKESWKQRLVGQWSSSPVAANGLVYLIDESGETVVLRPGPSFEQIARNQVTTSTEEVFRASLMPYDGQLFCRSNKRLFCIAPLTTLNK